MATNPFAGAGLGQFGRELSIPDAEKDSTIANTMKGLKDIAVVGIKNMMGIPASMPVPAPSSSPVPPYTGGAPMAPIAASPVVSPVDQDNHPELDLTTQTNLF